MDGTRQRFGALEVVAGRAVPLLLALWARVCCHAGQNKRPPGGRGGELEGSPSGRAAGGAGVWHDSRWCSDGSQGRRNARDLFARLARAIITGCPESSGPAASKEG